MYGGAYAYGKTRAASGYNATAIRSRSRRKARDEWLALIPGAHEGYVSWERAEAIRKMVSDNVPTGRHHGAPKHGDALLAGLVRCRRCGRKQAASRRDQVRDALMRDLEAARYSADRAFRQYDAIDPRNRLVAANWSCDGTGRLRVSARSRAGLPRMLPRHRSHHFCRQYTSPRSPPISRQCGRRRRRMQGSRSASFAPSSGRWSPISMTKRQR
ncbi:recombinase family protein [Mesorhizobium sp. M0046]|uniref:recombinase family protein n=1 Tax=Mesorhizobium sp. M0046 TaxID=2956858 RepID=UPI00333A9209